MFVNNLIFMFATSGDILRMSLALGFILLVIFLCILIFYTILVMRDVSKITDDVQDMVDMAHRAIRKPLNLVEHSVKKAEPFIVDAIEKVFGGGKKRRKK